MIIEVPYYSKTNDKKKIETILNAALGSVDPVACVKNNINIRNQKINISELEIDRCDYNKIFVIGIGKAVIPMAIGINDLLGHEIESGFLISKTKNPALLTKLSEKYHVVCGDHPIPSKKSVDAAKGLVQFLKKTKKGDLVLCLISGGGSALCTYPHDQIGINAMQSTTDLLLSCGATIQEINTIRKHVDRIKGGGLLDYISPSKSVTLLISDVIGDQLSMIASGPTVPDPTTFQDAFEVIQKYNISDSIDPLVLNFVVEGMEGQYKETLKPNAITFENNSNFIVGNLKSAVSSASRKSEELGFSAEVINLELTGEARVQGQKLGEFLREYIQEKGNAEKPKCFIAGGETTVTIRGDGKGGRNQELALAAAIELSGIENCAVVTFATDGEDGPTDAAGAIVTGLTVEDGIKKGMNANAFLENNDSYNYFKNLDLLIKPGATGTNVNDLVLLFNF